MTTDTSSSPNGDTKAAPEQEQMHSVMEEAEQLMEELGMVDEDPEFLSESLVIDGFSIDSDDEAEEAEKAQDNNNRTTKAPTSLQQEQAPPKTKVPLHPLHEDLLYSDINDNTTPAATPPATISPSTSSFDFKAKTSQFASNLATFAQKAAVQAVSAAASASSNVASVAPTTTTTMPPQEQTTLVSAETMDNEQKAALIQQYVGDLLKGERVIMFLSNLLHVSESSSGDLSGTWYCCMTYYRVILFTTDIQKPQVIPSEWNVHCWSMPESPQLLQMPLASMDRVEKSVYTTSSNHTMMGLLLYGKDNGRWLKFSTPAYADTLRVYEALHTYAFPGRRNLGYLFAFESLREQVMKSMNNGKITLPPTPRRFDALSEYKRQFRDLTVWTCWTQLNQNYQLCMSYPSIVAGPASLQESSPESLRIIRGSASFRSEQRLPALTWSSGVDGASLWRASQPKVGLQGNRSTADEIYLKHISESSMTCNALLEKKPFQTPTREQLQHLRGSSTGWTLDANCQLKILDLRPKSSAMANRTGGYGYENTSYYTGTTIQFCNIGNIHAVRDSYQKLSALCLNPATQDVYWNQSVEETKWLSMVRLILSAAWETAYWIHIYRLPVLLHCSHGWDRTSQVAVVAQLFLDPYYRTLKGFCTLVEKDFMGFGHPFHLRCGHGLGRGERGSDTPTSGSDDGQISPIFIQFLDCVFQVVRQYPECFEFNTKYLLVLSEHVYSCRFGTMLCDSERERELVAGIRQRTLSLWDYLEQREDVVNPNFKAGGILLMPLPTLMRNVVLWVDRHCMYGPKATLRSLPDYLERPPRYLPKDQQGLLNMEQDYHALMIEYEKKKESNETNQEATN